MLYQIAIDPRILITWLEYSYLVDDCGCESGRMLAQFPNRWPLMVWEAMLANPNHTPLDEQRIEFHMQHLLHPRSVLRTSNYIHQNKDWLIQAEQEHRRKPFHAIASNQNPRAEAGIIDINGFDKQTHPLWQSPWPPSILRTPDDLAGAATPLFQLSKAVKFVDPNFAPEMTRYRITLKAFLLAAKIANPGLTIVEYHLRAKATAGFFEKEFRQTIAPLIPAGLTLRFVRWDQRSGGDDLHDRYILTDRGGLYYGVGLDAGNHGETTPVSLLNARQRQQYWQQYDTAPKDDAGNTLQPHFDLVDQFQSQQNCKAFLYTPAK